MERGEEMKYAIYYQTEDSTECLFYKTEEEAKTCIGELIKECEEYSESRERNLNWEITLLKVIGECHWTQDGLTLRVKE
jgi:hypothetical protein